MAVTITETGQLINEAGPKNNPRELEFFSNTIDYTSEDGDTITGWSISGDIPVGITMNNGVISGTVLAMSDQPSCVPKRDHEYVEVDCRSYPDKNGSYTDNIFDFNFTTTVTYIDGLTLLEGSSSVDHMIRLVKNHTTAGEAMFRELLDGWYDIDTGEIIRAPYYCVFSGPSTQSQCEAIGGTWNDEKQVCNIFSPQNQTDCEAVGGEWDDTRSACSMTIIPSIEQCEAIGGVWMKNTLIVDGVEYDNYDDWKVAYDAYVATLPEE